MSAHPTLVSFSSPVIQPENNRLERSYQMDKITKVTEYPTYAAAQAALPAIGANIGVGISGGAYLVMSCKLEPLAKGGACRLIVEAENRNALATFEVDWTPLQKPLLSHPRYLTGGARALTSTDQLNIQKWQAEPNAALQRAFQFDGGTLGTITLGTNAQDYALKYLNGEDSYTVYTPIARIHEIGYTMLTVGAALGTYSIVAPFFGCPVGYQWILTADRAHSEFPYWTRDREFAGYDFIDKDLYS